MAAGIFLSQNREGRFEVKFTLNWEFVIIINSHAVGMGVARPYGFEIDFVSSPLSGPAAIFFFIILKFLFTFLNKNS